MVDKKTTGQFYPSKAQRDTRVKVLQRTGEALSLELKAIQERLEVINLELQTLKYIDVLDDGEVSEDGETVL